MMNMGREPLTPGWSGLRVPRACVMGLGLIGGSWAGALHQAGWDVFAIDQDHASIHQAIERGWIKAGWSILPEFLDVDLVILALPLSVLHKGLDELEGRIPVGTVVTDVGSLKMEICGKWHEAANGCSDYFFVGGHPMTGSEHSGFEAANPDLFRGYPYVLTPVNCPEQIVQKLASLVRSFGAKVVYRKPEKHDIEVAMVSHIPHLLAVALTLAVQEASKEGESAITLAGRSFRDVTRIADSSPEMWKEIMVRNSEAILEGLTLYEENIKTLKESLHHKDGEAIAEAFRKAHLVRTGLIM